MHGRAGTHGLRLYGIPSVRPFDVSSTNVRFHLRSLFINLSVSKRWDAVILAKQPGLLAAEIRPWQRGQRCSVSCAHRAF